VTGASPATQGVSQVSVQWQKSLARVTFGVVWGVDASFKWTPAFRQEYLDLLEKAAQGQPAWLEPWFRMWIGLIAPRVGFFAYATAVIETVIALALILGFARKSAYLLTAVFSFLIWSTAEGFGGPYTAGTTDVGTGIIYSLAAIFLLVINATAGTSRYSLDAWLERRIAWWAAIAEVGSRPRGRQTPGPGCGGVAAAA
jgi:nitrite reductase (NO-forming)